MYLEVLEIIISGGADSRPTGFLGSSSSQFPKNLIMILSFIHSHCVQRLSRNYLKPESVSFNIFSETITGFHRWKNF